MQTQATPSLHRNIRHQLQHLRHFARWVPYKPLPKPKHPQKLLAIKTLQSHLTNTFLISPFPPHGFSANNFKPLKTPHPQTKLLMVKNTLVSKALGGSQWTHLGPRLKGMNSLLFVKEEGVVGPALSGFKAKLKEGKREFNEFSGGVLCDGGVYGFKDLEVLENAPSRAEANGMLLGALFGPSSTLMAVLEGFGAEEGEGGGGGEGESQGADVAT